LLSTGKRRIEQLFEKSGVKAVLSTLILIIPLVLSSWVELLFIYKIILIATAASINLFVVYFACGKPKLKINEMSDVLTASLWQKERHHFRANVMLYNPQKETLSVKYLSSSMMGAVDRKLCIKSCQGCAGRAFQDKREMVVDLTEKSHRDFDIDPNYIWPDMKSILSVPIFEDDEHTKVKGVLSIDSDLPIDNTNFFDTTVISVVSVYADWLSGMIQER